MRILFIFATFILMSVPAMAGPVIDMTGSRTVAVYGQVDGNIIETAAKLDTLSRQSSDPINIVINSPGGSVHAGLQLVEAIHIAQARGVKVRCAVTTLAASMAFIILGECDERHVFANSLLLFHPASVGIMFGNLKAEDAEAIAEVLVAINDQMGDLMKTAMGVESIFDELWFRKHMRAETLWIASTLIKEVPNDKFLTVMSDLRINDNLFAPGKTAEASAQINEFLNNRGAL